MAKGVNYIISPCFWKWLPSVLAPSCESRESERWGSARESIYGD